MSPAVATVIASPTVILAQTIAWIIVFKKPYVGRKLVNLRIEKASTM